MNKSYSGFYTAEEIEKYKYSGVFLGFIYGSLITSVVFILAMHWGIV